MTEQAAELFLEHYDQDMREACKALMRCSPDRQRQVLNLCGIHWDWNPSDWIAWTVMMDGQPLAEDTKPDDAAEMLVELVPNVCDIWHQMATGSVLTHPVGVQAAPDAPPIEHAKVLQAICRIIFEECELALYHRRRGLLHYSPEWMTTNEQTATDIMAVALNGRADTMRLTDRICSDVVRILTSWDPEFVAQMRDEYIEITGTEDTDGDDDPF